MGSIETEHLKWQIELKQLTVITINSQYEQSPTQQHYLQFIIYKDNRSHATDIEKLRTLIALFKLIGKCIMFFFIHW